MVLKKVLFFGFVIAILVFGLPSCSSYKNIAYLQDVPDSTNIKIKNAQQRTLLIEKGDMLSIAIMTIDPSANAIFSQQLSISRTSNLTIADNSQGLTNLNGSSTPSYTVDMNGQLEMPLLGVFNAVGISTDSLRNLIHTRALEFYKTPAVIIKYANLRISVLGEVNKPGLINLYNEKNTILDAISSSGDLTIYGKRENIMLIRDSSGFSSIYRFNLLNKDIFFKPFYYLKQNDIIYVEPDKRKAAVLDEDKIRFYSLFTTGVTLLAALIYLFK